LVRELLARQARTRSDGPAWTPLHYAALRGHAGVLVLLLDAGGDINAVSDNGTTPLMLAASEGRLDAVTLLLKRGADVSRETDAGRTAGAWARSAGQSRIADILDAAARK
jgi:ankyrin repeat protein